MSNTNLIALSPIDSATKCQNDTKNTVLSLENTADVVSQASAVAQATVIELNFPKFTDGRAYSQAALLRSRLGFKGEIRAVGDVLIDQLLPMQRCGFSSAQLRSDQDASLAPRLLGQFGGFYQANTGRLAAAA